MSNILYQQFFDDSDIWSVGITVRKTTEGIAVRWMDHTDDTPRTEYYWKGLHPDLDLLKDPDADFNDYVTNGMAFFEQLKLYIPWRIINK